MRTRTEIFSLGLAGLATAVWFSWLRTLPGQRWWHTIDLPASLLGSVVSGSIHYSNVPVSHGALFLTFFGAAYPLVAGGLSLLRYVEKWTSSSGPDVQIRKRRTKLTVFMIAFATAGTIGEAWFWGLRNQPWPAAKKLLYSSSVFFMFLGAALLVTTAIAGARAFRRRMAGPTAS